MFSSPRKYDVYSAIGHHHEQSFENKEDAIQQYKTAVQALLRSTILLLSFLYIYKWLYNINYTYTPVRNYSVVWFHLIEAKLSFPFPFSWNRHFYYFYYYHYYFHHTTNVHRGVSWTDRNGVCVNRSMYGRGIWTQRAPEQKKTPHLFDDRSATNAKKTNINILPLLDPRRGLRVLCASCVFPDDQTPGYDDDRLMMTTQFGWYSGRGSINFGRIW